jgi:hypothetical protein
MCCAVVSRYRLFQVLEGTLRFIFTNLITLNYWIAYIAASNEIRHGDYELRVRNDLEGKLDLRLFSDAVSDAVILYLRTGW